MIDIHYEQIILPIVLHIALQETNVKGMDWVIEILNRECVEGDGTKYSAEVPNSFDIEHHLLQHNVDKLINSLHQETMSRAPWAQRAPKGSGSYESF